MEASYLPQCPVEAVTFISKLERPSGYRSKARSIPGHLLHYIIRGGYTLLMNGREYRINRGDIIYYYETEDVEWKQTQSPVSFYSIGFMAKKLPPLPFEQRKMKAPRGAEKLFREMHRASSEKDGFQRTFRLYSLLLNILARIYRPGEAWSPQERSGSGWWRVERYVREKKRFRPRLAELAEIAGMSKSGLHRECMKVFNKAPLKRVREIRMEEARGFLRFSAFSVTEIALILGYNAIGEFTREFTKYFNLPPTKYYNIRLKGVKP